MNGVAFEQATGFTGKTEGPFQTDSLKEGRSHFDFSGVESEGRTDAEIDGGRKTMLLLGKPSFLFWTTKAGPHNIGFGFGQLGQGFFVMLFGPITKWRGIVTDNLGIWETLVEILAKGDADLFTAPKEEMAQLAGRLIVAPLESPFHQGWTVDSILKICSVFPVKSPNEGHAVRNDKVERINDLSVAGVVSSQG